jgi:hypothetical protein
MYPAKGGREQLQQQFRHFLTEMINFVSLILSSYLNLKNTIICLNQKPMPGVAPIFTKN